MANHEFSVGDIIKVRGGVKLPPGYTATCEKWVGEVKELYAPGRIGVSTLITRSGTWRDEERYYPVYPVEERFFEIAQTEV